MPHRVIRQAAVAPLPLVGLRSRHLETSVGRVHVLEGAGPDPDRLPLVIIHGFASSSFDYLPLILRLRTEAGRLMAPDLPAHGLSDVPPGGLTAEALRAGVLESLDQLLDDGPAVLFGNSLGGQVAIRYARHRPERVAGLVLSSPGGAGMSAEELEIFLEAFRVDDEDAALEFLDRLLARRPKLLRKVLALQVRRKLSRDALRRLIDTVTPLDLLAPDEVRGLEVPTLVLWGQRERLLPDAHFAFFEEHLPDHARIERPPSFGHAPHIEHAGELAQRVRRFVRELEMHRAGLAPRARHSSPPPRLVEPTEAFPPELLRT